MGVGGRGKFGLVLICLALFDAVFSSKCYWRGARSQEVGEEGDYIQLTLHCHHQNDSFIKMGNDENHFNVSLIVRDSRKTVSTGRNF